MKTLLLIALAASAAYAVPLPADRSEVDLVPPRRVYTGDRTGSLFPGGMTDFTPRLDFRELLRRMLETGFPSLEPRSDPYCDRINYRLSHDVFDNVTKCERTHSSGEDLRKCILDVLPDDAVELRNFLNRDDYRIAGISSTIVIINGKVLPKRPVSFRLCPPADEVNSVDVELSRPPQSREPQEPEPETRPSYRPVSPFSLFGSGRRPTFQIPDIFSQDNPFPNFDDAFKPFFDFKPKFPTFPSFDFNPASFPSAGYDPETCVKQSFQLPKEQFDKAKECTFVGSFKECLSEKLGEHEESKDLLAFIRPDDVEVVGRSFFRSVSSVNGTETRKNKIQLTRCAKAEEPAGEGGQDQGQETTLKETPQPSTPQQSVEDLEP